MSPFATNQSISLCPSWDIWPLHSSLAAVNFTRCMAESWECCQMLASVFAGSYNCYCNPPLAAKTLIINHCYIVGLTGQVSTCYLSPMGI